ncbi:hypothetical protein GCM10028806_09500 [Spirosoma terrae]|uniref:Uncharacterized protein n=1 Tax=Spirosoma terrae TaxID=1968276 RepID=A0A6L9LBP8_9BACT|nr:hypothetical protein [Spirosoma terrae]NDU95908.1 hypothetical protein [Spirosoma terrae]
MEKLTLEEKKLDELGMLPINHSRIYSNLVTDINEENKLIRYSSKYNTDLLRSGKPRKIISKTINYSLFDEE